MINISTIYNIHEVDCDISEKYRQEISNKEQWTSPVENTDRMVHITRRSS